MKLWIGARLDSDINDVFRVLRNEIESSINQHIEYVDYGDGVKCWDLVLVIFSEGGNEYFRFKKKTKETDIQLCIDYEEFKNGNSLKKQSLIYDALLNSIDIMQDKSIKDLDFVLLKKDILKLRNKKLG